MTRTKCSKCNTVFLSQKIGQLTDDRVGVLRSDGIIVPGRKSTFNRHLIEVPDAVFNSSNLIPGNVCDPCIQEIVNDGAKIL